MPRPKSGDQTSNARVSTADQDLSGQATRLKDAGAIRVFEDVISGKQFKRPGPSPLLDQDRPGDSLAITRLDRLGRSLKELLEAVEHLKAQNIGLISLEERIDTTSAAGDLIFHVFGAIAHFERRLISERTKDGIAAARAQGMKPGRPLLEAETILALQNLVVAGMTAGQVAKQLGIARSTAYRLTKETTDT
jgi:DNA invertase Pin-like site-specific DNA recombinase